MSPATQPALSRRSVETPRDADRAGSRFASLYLSFLSFVPSLAVSLRLLFSSLFAAALLLLPAPAGRWENGASVLRTRTQKDRARALLVLRTCSVVVVPP